jgi:hypothetical protein
MAVRIDDLVESEAEGQILVDRLNADEANKPGGARRVWELVRRPGMASCAQNPQIAEYFTFPSTH